MIAHCWLTRWQCMHCSASMQGPVGTLLNALTCKRYALACNSTCRCPFLQLLMAQVTAALKSGRLTNPGEVLDFLATHGVTLLNLAGVSSSFPLPVSVV